MNAAMMLMCVATGMTTGQPQDTIFKAPKIEVKTETRDGKSYSYLMYNRVYIGRQYDKEKNLPTTYFHDKSPIGLILKDPKWFPQKDAPPIGVLGMDIGTVAAYAKPGQTIHFTERVPTFVKLSIPDKGEKRYFTFVQDAIDRGAKVKIFEGEPREMIEKHGKDGFYKVIVVECWKMPVIDVHKELMTKEALAMLMSKLREDGIVAFHTSSRYYQLPAIIASAANELKLACVVGNDLGYYHEKDGKNEFRFSSEWVMIARAAKHLAHLKKDATNQIDWHEPRLQNLTRGKLTETKIDKEFLWTDKGEQSFRGLYRSDPIIDQLHDSLYDMENYFGGRSHEFTRPLHDLIRSWSNLSADTLNRPKKSAPKDDKK